MKIKLKIIKENFYKKISLNLHTYTFDKECSLFW